MAKLKLSAVDDYKPVRLTVELPGTLHRELIAYGEEMGRESGAGAVEPVRLVAPMLARFMATDRPFAKARRAASPSLAPAPRSGDASAPGCRCQATRLR